MNEPTHRRPGRPHATPRERDQAASNMVAMLLGLGIVVTLVGPMWMLTDSIMDAMNAQRQAADKASWCARHPDRPWPGEGECPDPGPRGWECEPADHYQDVLKCVAIDSDNEPYEYVVVHEGDLESNVTVT